MTTGTDDATLRLETISQAVPLPVASPDETLRLTAVDATQRLETIPDPVPTPGPDPASLPIGKHLATYLQHLAIERGMAKNTVSAYRRDLFRYALFLHAQGVTGPGEVTLQHLTNFAQAVRDGADGAAPLSARSAARTIVAVRGVHKFWELEGLTLTNPAVDLHPPTDRAAAAQGHQRRSGRGHHRIGFDRYVRGSARPRDPRIPLFHRRTYFRGRRARRG